MNRKHTLSLMFDRDDTLRSCILNDNVGLEANSCADVEDLPPYIYERMALLKLTDNLTTVEHIGRRVGLGYYVIYLDRNEYNELKELILKRKSANENETKPTSFIPSP